MSGVGKLLAIVNIGQQTYNRWLFQQLVPSIILVAGLTIVVSIIISMILVGGFYVSYGALLNYGLEQKVAMMIIITAAVITLLIFLILTFLGVCRLRHMPKEILKKSPLNYITLEVLTAFLDGFMSDQSRKKDL
jgi:hypothetical protein